MAGADTLWESRDSAGFALTVAREGQVLVGTGLKGRIYCLERGRKPLLLSQSAEAQTVRFVKASADSTQRHRTWESFSRLGVAPVRLVCIRHPYEMLRSLQRGAGCNGRVKETSRFKRVPATLPYRIQRGATGRRPCDGRMESR
jgi:hypothetical protein